MIPVFTFCYEIPVLQTPDEVYCALKSPFSFLFQSPNNSAPEPHFSFAGFSPFLIYTSQNNASQLDFLNDGAVKRKTQRTKNPLMDLKNIFHSLQPSGEHGLPFTLGAAGFISYEAARFFERLARPKRDELGAPEFFFIFCRIIFVFSHSENKTRVFIHIPWCESKMRAEKQAQKEFYSLLERLCASSAENMNHKRKKKIITTLAYLSSSMSKSQYMRAVRKVKQYIADGDIYQANIAQQLSATFNGDAFAFYRSLMDINPSPFSAFIDAKHFQIASCSPERLLKVHGRTAETRPIAGTRPRSAKKKEDEALAKELLLNKKEKAEHLMLVDLERNDLGRVCEYKSVHVNEFMMREDYSHVFHIVSNVRGILQKNKDSFDAIQACFPGGTITGCPKIRSMEIIHEMENVKRGIYTGSIGYMNFNGDMDLNIAIRTAILKNKKIFFSAGAGIVADSDPEREYYETLYKAEALVRALEKSQSQKIKNFSVEIFKPEKMQ